MLQYFKVHYRTTQNYFRLIKLRKVNSYCRRQSMSNNINISCLQMRKQLFYNTHSFVNRRFRVCQCKDIWQIWTYYWFSERLKKFFINNGMLIVIHQYQCRFSNSDSGIIAKESDTTWKSEVTETVYVETNEPILQIANRKHLLHDPMLIHLCE